mgnify:CR=1 FL=1
MTLRKAVVHGMGHSVPAKVMTNDDLEKLVETSDEWIVQRTGIKERRVTSDDESASTLAIAAAQEALANAKLDPADVNVVICATVTGDYPFPATASLVQDAIGAKNAGAFDVGAACAGFIYASAVGAGLLESRQFENALVIGADVLTKFVDWTDRSTCVLFGDGAAAMVLKAEDNTDRGVMKTVLLSDGSGAKHIVVDAGGSKIPQSSPAYGAARKSIYMNGAETYRFAVTAMGDACCKVLADAGLEASDVDLFVPHQANLRIIQSAAKRIGLPDEKVFVNVHKYGNTSGGSIPLGLYEAEKQGLLVPGKVVMTVGFGAGLVWGANLIRW